MKQRLEIIESGRKFKLIYAVFSLLFAIALVLFTISGNATIYYVSSSGNDSNQGTSEDLPWRSLAKVNNFFKLEPGDQILFKRGDEWNGTLIVRASGTEENPIVYGAYGVGEKPKIYGSEIITGWTLHEGNIWKASSIAAITQLFINDVRLKAARHPNSGWHKVSGINSQTQFISSGIASHQSDFYKGANILIKTNEFRLDTRHINTSSGQTLTFNSNLGYKLVNGISFFLINKLEFLDQPGEWYYDDATNTIYLWTTKSDSPENYAIRGTVHDKGISIDVKNHITLKDLNILQQYDYGIYSNGTCTGLTFTNNDISDVESIGIKNTGSNTVISYNQISEINYIGLSVGGGGNCTVTDNQILNTSLFENLGIRGMVGGISYAMTLGGNNNLIKNNRIENASYNGINFVGFDNIIINNFIKNTCILLPDGGGLYTYSTALNIPVVNGTIIRGNIVDGHNGVAAIYMDNATQEVTIENNTVINTNYNTGIGILLNNDNQNNKVNYNTLFNNPVAFRSQSVNSGNTFNNNIVCNDKNMVNVSGKYTVEPQQININISQGKFIVADNNTYIDLHRTTVFNFGKYPFSNFNQWQTETKQDKNSKFIAIHLPKGESEKLFYNDTKQTKIFYLGKSVFRDIYGNAVKDTFTLKPFTSKILIGKNFENINQSPAVLDQSFNVVSPKITNDFIGQVVANDPDTGQIINYTIVGGNETEIFAIDSLTGEIHSKTDIKTSKDISIILIVHVKDNAVNSLSDSAKVIINIEGRDTSPPLITSFSIPSSAISLSIPINLFTASDDIAVTGYLLTKTSLTPLAGDSSWTTSIPVLYSFLQEGVMHLYAWAKDSVGNVSISASDSVIITLPDMSPTFSTYLFEETEGVTVIDSISHNHGTIFNNALRVDGVRGRGIELTGAGYINLGQNFGENVENEISLSVWIKPAASTGNYQGIIMHGGPDTETYALYIQPDSKTIGFTTNGTSNALLTIDNVNELWDGNWHHLAVIYNGTEKVIYLDNVALINIAATGKIDLGWKYNLLIGAGRDEIAPTLLYDGLIDEVRIYNYALTSSEVGNLYHPVNKVIKKINITEYVSVCRGKEYMGWSETGQYEQVLQRILPSASGADSIVTTNLQVNPVYYNTDKAAVCEGETYTFGTQRLIATGEYTEQFETVDGCDSIVVLSLTVHPVYHNMTEATICEGENYTFGTQSLKVTGEYTELFMTVNGCDSTEILILTVNPEYNITEEVTISDTDDYLGWTNEGTYLRNLISSSGCDSVVVTNLKVVQSLTQFIGLEKGWNIFSSYLIPNNENMESVMETIRTEGKLDIVQDETGNSYQELSPQGWINNIGNLQKSEGYKIRVESPCILEIKGRQIDLPMNIELKKGLNIISFPINESTDAMQVIEPLIHAGILEKVQDEKGKSIEYWIGIGWIKGIGNFIAGKGYIVYTNESGILTINQTKEKSNLLYEENNPQTTYFRVFYEGNGFAHMNINVVGLNESQLSVGDEIAVFDNHICVGAIKLTEKHFSLNVVGITASASEIKLDNGFTDGNPIEIRVWSHTMNSGIKLLPDLIKGKLIFNRYGSVFIKINEISDLNENIDIYPNPANAVVNIRFLNLPEEGIKILLFDITGKEILRRDVKSNFEIIKVEDLPAGVYFVKIPINNQNITHKLIII